MAAAMTTPLSMVYILFWLVEMGLAGPPAGACADVDADCCARTATGTADNVANSNESFLITRSAPLRMRLHRLRKSRKRSGGDLRSLFPNGRARSRVSRTAAELLPIKLFVWRDARRNGVFVFKARESLRPPSVIGGFQARHFLWMLSRHIQPLPAVRRHVV